MVPDPFSEPERGLAEARLRELPEVELLGVLRRSSNYTFLASLGDDSTPPDDRLLAVYKPARGESPLWDFPDGTLYRREVAAYLLARALGWPRIPPTVVREEAPHGVGAMQLFIEADQARNYLNDDGQPARVWLEVSLFDVITNNADRKAGHCLIDAGERAWVIDHGLTFHVETKLRTVIWDYAGSSVPRALKADLSRVCEDLESGELGAQLSELISRRELRVLRQRVEGATGAGWRFPHPSSSWSVPWPPV